MAGRTIALKLGPGDAELEGWLERQNETPSALIRRALILLMNNGEIIMPASSAAFDADALNAAIKDGLAEGMKAIAGEIGKLTAQGQPSPIINMPPVHIHMGQPANGNGNGHHSPELEPVRAKAKRPTKTVKTVEPSELLEPIDEEAAIEAAADNFLSAFG